MISHCHQRSPKRPPPSEDCPAFTLVFELAVLSVPEVLVSSVTDPSSPTTFER